MTHTVNTLTKSQLKKHRADVLVVPVRTVKKDVIKESVALGLLDEASAGATSRVWKETSFSGGVGETFWMDGRTLGVAAERVLLIGLGDEKRVSLEQVRRMAGTALLTARVMQPKAIAFLIDDCLKEEFFVDDVAQGIIEGVELAAYRFLKYKKEEEKQWKKSLPKQLQLVTLEKGREEDLKRGIAVAKLAVRGTVLARDLINEPAIHVTPTSLSTAAQAIAKENPVVKVKVFGEKEMKKLGMGALLSVAAGSDEEAQFIHLSYKPKAKKGMKPKRVVFCGKGITFDSGGLSIKPGDYMHGMKMDMSGAAAVLGLFSQIQKLAPEVEVHGVIPATENMPSGTATRPGDVVTAYDGTTIEVTNTDAEGRLVLADAMSWSVANLKPDYIVDLATLTGAAIIALGQEVAPYYTRSEELKEWLENATGHTGEAMWHMPLVDEYIPFLKSPIADLDNSPRTRWAGSIIGALFLEPFAKDVPWMHIDIAGPAMVEKQMLSYAPVGGSGFGVRTMMEMLKEVEHASEEIEG